MREEEKIFAGQLFSPGDPELRAIKLRAHNLNTDYNKTYEHETEKRAAILSQLVGEMGEGSFIQGPVTFHYGVHTKIGKRFFGNFNLTVQDDAPVTIGDDCWLGANVVVCSGVTIGNGCVIGAGSVVTKDIPDNSFAAGVPCRVIRPITEEDSMKYKPEIADGYRPME